MPCNIEVHCLCVVLDVVILQDLQTEPLHSCLCREQDCLPAGAPRTKAGHTNVVVITIAIICGIAFAGAATFAVYQHRILKAVKHDNLNSGYISLNAVGRDSA